MEDPAQYKTSISESLTSLAKDNMTELELINFLDLFIKYSSRGSNKHAIHIFLSPFQIRSLLLSIDTVVNKHQGIIHRILNDDRNVMKVINGKLTTNKAIIDDLESVKSQIVHQLKYS